MSQEHFLSHNAGPTNEPLLRSYDALAAAIDDFLLEGESKRLAPKTLRGYQSALDRLQQFSCSGGQTGDLTPAEIDVAFLRRWQRQLIADGLSATSQATYLRRVKTWLRWLADEGGYGVDRTVCERVKAPRLDTEQPHPFSEQEIVALFAACNLRGWLGMRSRAIIAVLLDTGVRASELCGLRLQDVDLTTGTIVVRATTSKSRREREIALGRRAKQEVTRWWFRKRALLDRRPESPFFCGRTERALTQTALTHLIAALGRKAGVARAHPHRFRHTCALTAIRAGMNPLTVMHLLGHTSFTMTQRYIRLANADVSVEKRLKSPLDQLKLRG